MRALVPQIGMMEVIYHKNTYILSVDGTRCRGHPALNKIRLFVLML